MFKKDGLLYTTYGEYVAENTVDHEIRRARQKRISENIDKDLHRYIKREKKLGRLKWNP